MSLPTHLLRCPRCRSELILGPERVSCRNAACAFHEDGFPVVDDQPVLIDFESSVISREAFLSRAGGSPIRRDDAKAGLRSRLQRRLLGRNRAALRCARRLRALAGRGGARPIALVVGGGSLSDGVAALAEGGDLDVLGTDIYLSPFTRLAADGHRLPFADEAFDAVWIEAVLEHVLDPGAVVSEIERVLKPGGLVFADTPFMQQVHEAPFDFTRFSASGHRWLFRNFECLDAGASAGAGTALAWSLRYFVRAVTGSALLGRLAGAACAWLRLFDHVGDARHHRDAASGVFFLGALRGAPVVTAADVRAIYENGPARLSSDSVGRGG